MTPAGPWAGSGVVGRDVVLGSLAADLSRAARGQGRLVLVAGEPGIGKTTVALSLAEAARERGFEVRWGRAWDGDGAPGYWPWHRVVRGLPDAEELFSSAVRSPELVDSASSVRSMESVALPETTSFAMFAAISAALEDAAVTRPQLIVLDDLQWAGSGCLRLFDFVARELSRSATLLVGTYRDTDVSPTSPLATFLRSLPSESRTERLVGLDPADVGDLLTSTGSGTVVPAALAQSVHVRTGGNPFFVLQVAHLLHTAESPGSGSSETRSAIPAGVEDAVNRRMARLDAPCVGTLEVAAVIGRVFDAALLATVAATSEAEAADRLHPAVRAGVLTSEPISGFQFTHDLFREVLYAGLAPSRRSLLHHAVGTALADRRRRTGAPSAAEVATHLALALPHAPAQDVIDAALDAALEDERALAHAEAAGHVEVALQVSEQSGVGDALDLRVTLAESLLRAGDRRRSRIEFLRSVDATGLRRPSLLGRSALGLHRLGVLTGAPHPEVLEPLELAVRALPASTDTDPGLAARVRAALARELADGPGRDLPRATQLAQEGASLARRSRDDGALALCLLAEHDLAWGPGTARSRLALADEMATAARVMAGDVLVDALLCRFVALVELADPRAESGLLAVTSVADELRSARATYLAMSRQAAWHLVAGQRDEAATKAAGALALGVAIGEPDVYGVWGTQVIVFALTYDGAKAVFAALAANDIHLPPEMEGRERAFGHLASGDLESVGAILRGVPAVGELADFRWRALAVVVFDIELALAAGLDDVLVDRYDELAPHSDEVVVIGGMVVALGPASLYLGLAASALQRWEDAAQHLRAAVKAARRLGARPWVARSMTELAWVLHHLTPDDATDEKPLLDQAERAARELGLTPLLERQAELRSATHRTGEFRRQGDLWTLSFAGRTVHVPDSKGLRDLAVLLSQPETDVPAAALLRADSPGSDQRSGRDELGSDAILDSQARAAYRRRLEELQEIIDEAESDHDLGRLEAAADERQVILDELGRALGLGGRARRLGDLGERARTTVTARIRDRLRRLQPEHPELAAHLVQSVHTGRSCRYSPAERVVWRF